MNFEIKTEPLSDHAFVVAIAGEVDLYVAPELKQQLLEVIGRGATQVIVDLTDATFVDSTTLGVLDRRRPAPAGERRRGSRSSAATATSRRSFELTGLDRVFAIYPTREQAVARIDGEPRVSA